jgi:ABC-type multidrug transport system fused ATPase/permease subunit
MSTYLNTVDPPDLGLLPTFRRLLGLWRAQWKLGVFALSCSLTYTLISITIPILIQRAIDHAIVPHHERKLWPYLAAIVGLASFRMVVNFNRRYATARIGVRIEARMRELLYQAYLRYPRAFYDRHATGQVLSRATNDLYPIRYFIGWGLVQGIQSVMMIVAVGIVLSLVDPRLTLYAAVALPPIGLVAYRFGHLVSPISRQVQARKGDVTEAADEAVVGIEMVQAFGREDDVRNRFGDRAEGVRSAALRQAGVESQHVPGLYYLPALSIAAVVFFGGRAVINHDITIGQFVLFETLLLQLVWPLEAIGWILDLAQRALASAGRSFGWLDGIKPLPEPARPRHLPPAAEGGRELPPGVSGFAADASSMSGPLGVRFERVSFAYGGEVDVLRDLDLIVEPGEIVAVCGPTGSGKTSLLNLLPRFYDPTGGRVLVGGVDTRDVPIAELRADVAIVTQRPVLFSVPLRENLTAGREDADWEEVLAASEAAGVDAFGPSLPDGYDTLIGERGVNLSGGQRQRVALARALVARARVVVLDDPLSAVDTLTERRLVARLRPALSGRTVLVATQRLSTIALADRAVVLLDGQIVESGTPADLLRADGPFAALFGDEVAAA